LRGGPVGRILVPIVLRDENRTRIARLATLLLGPVQAANDAEPLAPAGVICQAIEARLLLEFVYSGLPRVVAPYCHGFTAQGAESLRGVQVGGDSRSGHFQSGKLWTVGRIQNLRVTDRPFVPDDPEYEPDDRAMPRIHCRI
jgi:hypothetical protein